MQAVIVIAAQVLPSLVESIEAIRLIKENFHAVNFMNLKCSSRYSAV